MREALLVVSGRALRIGRHRVVTPGGSRALLELASLLRHRGIRPYWSS